MEVKTYRAKTMRDVLDLVRRELGPSAAVLHTRELNRGVLSRLVFGPQYEVAASAGINVPSRLPAEVTGVRAQALEGVDPGFSDRYPTPDTAYPDFDYRSRYRDDFRQQVAGQLDELHAMVEQLCQRAAGPGHDMPASLFEAFTRLIEAEVDETIVRQWLERIRTQYSVSEVADARLVQSRVAELLADEIKVAGPISIEADRCQVVALVGPTGVGKTTTIAKLAANYRLREKRQVGLITVDTYRVAAVEQLRTYAEIIDLPMEVVATPREMRDAVARMSHLDLVLMDTAGRSPRDEVKIQELKSMLAEAEPDNVYLVLSSTSAAKALVAAAERFTEVGVTATLLTKLDEASSLGNLVSLIRSSRLPVSYLTDGQNVPDDIQVADARQLAHLLLGMK